MQHIQMDWGYRLPHSKHQSRPLVSPHIFLEVPLEVMVGKVVIQCIQRVDDCLNVHAKNSLKVK